MLTGDHCHNIDRIMRLPGTINMPDERKRKKGRVPCLANIVEEDWSRTYSLSNFTPAVMIELASSKITVVLATDLPEVDLDDLPLKPYYKGLIEEGQDHANPAKFPSRSEALYAVCCEMVRAGCDDMTIAATILNPLWEISSSVLDNKDSKTYAERQIMRARQDVAEPELARLNARYFVVGSVGGKCVIARKVRNYLLKRDEWEYQQPEQFFHWLSNEYYEYIDSNGKSAKKNLGRWWFSHPLRRQYSQTSFAPNHTLPEDVFNLWEGFAFTPTPGNMHESYLAHIKDNICNGDNQAYEYLVRWMARAIQQPDTPGEVAVVLVGGKGVGKTQFVEHFGCLFGRHYAPIINQKHIVGSFNSRLHECILLFADEAVAVDKRNDGIFKALITDREFILEKKGVDAVPAANCTHLIMASNDSHVVNYTMDERRYLVLRVGDGAKRNRPYFRTIDKDLSQGGYAHLLHYLQTLSIEEWDHTDVPFTEEASAQMVASAGKLLSWLLNILHEGILPGVDIQKQNQPNLMCLGMAAESVGYESNMLRERLIKMGIIINPKPIYRKAYVNPKGMVVGKAGRDLNGQALPSRMYVVEDLQKLRERYARLAPHGWPEDGNQWRLEEDVVTEMKDFTVF